jgi:hypothetical protein
LTFFTTAADCRTLEDSFLVTEVFDNYVAMPYGHVESNIYSQLKAKAGQLSNIQITKSSATYLPDGSKESILEVLAPYPEIVQRIDDAHQKLRSINPKLITMKPFYLVDLSHTWFSWKKNYAAATTSGRYSESIPAVDIITEEKYYFLY